MRQLKYYIKGTKGKIQVSKGTYLTMKKRKKEKKGTKKLLSVPCNSQLKKQKFINKNVLNSLQMKKNCSNVSLKKEKKKPIFLSLDSFSEAIKQREKKCPDTIESQKAIHENDAMVPCVSEFSLGMQNEIPEQISKKPQHVNLDRSQKQSDIQQFKQQFEHFFIPSNYMINEIETDHQEYFDERECEDSTWSMINENVQAMALSLSLSVYDHLYGHTR